MMCAFNDHIKIPKVKIPFNPDKVYKYHAEIGFPKNITVPSKTYESLKYGPHATKEAMSDRYGMIVNLPTSFDPKDGYLFEIEVLNNKVIKCAYRIKYDETRDLIIVVIPQSNVVKTVWINVRSDKHFTLNRELYDKP